MMPPVPSRQIADVLAVNLQTAFDGLCEHRYGGPISLERIDPPDEAPSSARFRLRRADLPELRVDFEIRYVGGNVYDVRSLIDGGPAQTFVYCLPEPLSHTMPRAPRLVREIASFLLDALERRVGGELLRNEIRGRRMPTPPGRRAARSSFSS
jgi:hypothetical protein